MNTVLAITGVGMLTPVGLTALVSMHSVRSSVSRLGQQRIPDRAQEWVVGGRVYTWTPFVGARHLQALAEASARRAWRQSNADFARTVVILAAPDVSRPGVVFPRPQDDLLRWALDCGLGSPLGAEAVAAGACSTQVGLQRLLTRDLNAAAGAVGVVGGVDSQLHLRTVRWHENNHRLKCSYFTDGVMPGEAACFLVVEPEDHALRRGADVIARIASVAVAREPATVLSDEPNTARGLTDAIRTALEEADVPAREVGIVFSDLNGESYRAREWAFAEMRLGFQEHTELIHPADCHGDLGTATDAALLGLAALCHATGWSEGKPVLVFSGSEGGVRAATVVLQPGRERPFLQVSMGLPRVLSTAFRIPPPDPPRDFRRSSDPPREYFEWQLRENHRDDLAALHYQRCAILNDPTIPWPRLKEPEQRMLNHLDAAVASGPASMAALASSVAADEEGLSFAGALLIGTLPTSENFELLRAALTPASPPRSAGVAAALVHAPDSEALREFVRLSTEALPLHIRTLAVHVAGARRIDIRARLPHLLEGTDPYLVKAALDTARQLAAEDMVGSIKPHLAHQDPDVRSAATFALLRLTPAPTASFARSALDENVQFGGALATCLGIAGQFGDVRLLSEYIGTHPDDTSAVEALGILGSPQAVPLLIELLTSASDDVKAAAVGALELIAGPPEKAGQLRERSSEGPAPNAWAHWWSQQRRRLDTGTRWRRGQYFTLHACIDELADPMSAHNARGRVHLELIVRGSVEIPFEPYWFVPRQNESIRAWRSWWAQQGRR